MDAVAAMAIPAAMPGILGTTDVPDRTIHRGSTAATVNGDSDPDAAGGATSGITGIIKRRAPIACRRWVRSPFRCGSGEYL